MFYCCHNKLLQIAWFKITQIYYLTVSKGRKPNTVPTLLKVRCQQDCIPSGGSEEKSDSKLIQAVRYVSSTPCRCRAGLPASRWPGAGLHLPPKAFLGAVPGHRGPTTAAGHQLLLWLRISADPFLCHSLAAAREHFLLLPRSEYD